MKLKPLGRPDICNLDCQVHEIHTDGDILAGYVIVFDDGTRIFEFDSDRRYGMDDMIQIMELAKNAKSK